MHLQIRLEVKSRFISQMWIKLSIPNDLQWYHITVHNMNQMYLPETDQVFGSYYFYLKIPKPHKNGTCLIRDYELTRTRWKTLDKQRNRCDAGEAEAKTTHCITNHLENALNCSIGLQGSNVEIKR